MAMNILAPAAVLILWTLIVLLWMFATRMKGFSDKGIDLTKADPGARYIDVEAQMDAKVNWKAHNYTHLMETPTIFYAVVFVIALAGGGSTGAVWWAWGYTVLRILHSLWQCLINTVPVRFMLFIASNICLFVLAYYAIKLTF